MMNDTQMNEINNTQNNEINENWLGGVSEELRSNESLGKFKNIDDFARSYLEIEKNYNKRISIPDEKASPEERGKFFDKLGRPSDKKYLVDNRKADDDSIVKLYEDVFHQNGLSRRQGESILKKMYELQEANSKNFSEGKAKFKDTNLSFLSEQYKDKFDEKMKIGLNAVKKYGSDSLFNLLEEVDYHPALVDMLVTVGETIRPDSIVSGNTGENNFDTPETALKEIKKLEANQDFMVKYNNKKHVGHAAAVKELNDLYAVAYKK